ncbi:MAG TPA: sigma-54 dependent transcriptional regulator [Vicinamibacteria bacterium]|nr:sigma-54 dependent transcriptional regulator [Vicinamibacteria bacterium]
MSATVPAGLVYRSLAMQKVLDVAARLLDARTPVLLQGESGTGKDLLARHLHEASGRREGPFVAVHCPSVPEELVESELFGHERGAFTDARQTKLGKVEMAEGGTLYFDQVQDLALPLQAKLLRVVEEKRFERLGGTRTLEVDVRFVFSSNVELRAAVLRGAFRDDLFHRLSVVELELPPLRERREDVLPLALHFLKREQKRGATRASGFDAEAEGLLLGYAWPGNVRELRAAVERAALLATGETLTAADLPPHLRRDPQALFASRERPPSLKELEQAYIRHVLREADGQQTRAARVLGISRKALWEKRRRYGIP